MKNYKKFAQAHKNDAFSHLSKSVFRLVGERSSTRQPALSNSSARAIQQISKPLPTGWRVLFKKLVSLY